MITRSNLKITVQVKLNNIERLSLDASKLILTFKLINKPCYLS